MKRLMTGGAALVLVALAGCGGAAAKREAVIKDAIQVTNEMADVLETIKDKATAEAALPKLRALYERAKEIRERRKAITGVSDEDNNRLDEKYRPEYKKAVERVMDAEEKVNKLKIPEGDEAVSLTRNLPMS